MTPLSRRDRAALELAYGQLLRESGWLSYRNSRGGAYWVLPYGGDVASAIQAAWHMSRPSTGDRLIKARVALLIRALLRADRGDYGPVRFTAVYDEMIGAYIFGSSRCPSTRRYTPLWEQAPAHEEET